MPRVPDSRRRKGMEFALHLRAAHMSHLRKGAFLKRVILVTLIVLLAFTSGMSTKLVTSWKNPSYSGQRFTKILVLGVSKNPSIRADFEDALSAKVTRPGVEAVPGNTILLRPESTQLDINYLKTQVRENKIDAVIMSRLIKDEKNITYIPGDNYFIAYPTHRTFYGYYGTVYAQVYSPDYLREDRKVRIETSLYAATAPDGELIWTGISDTFNPKSAHKTIDGLVKLVVRELEKVAILKKPLNE